jgi:hypothetical protein
LPHDSIVLNEWIFHDIRGENGPQFQEQAESFLQAFIGGTDQIVVLRESRWTEKAWQLWEEHDTRVQILSKLLFLGILIDPLKSRYLDQNDVTPLPDDLAEQVPGDDAYLFQTALAGGATHIVTSDERLIASVSNAHFHGIQLRQRVQFIEAYLNL